MIKTADHVIDLGPEGGDAGRVGRGFRPARSRGPPAASHTGPGAEAGAGGDDRRGRARTGTQAREARRAGSAGAEKHGEARRGTERHGERHGEELSHDGTRVEEGTAVTALLALAAIVAAGQVLPFDSVVQNLKHPDPKVRLESLRLLRDAGYPEAAGPVARS